MARVKQYQVDAFATRVFEGNPAAVVPLDAWLEDRIFQAIAEENNLSNVVEKSSAKCRANGRS